MPKTTLCSPSLLSLNSPLIRVDIEFRSDSRAVDSQHDLLTEFLSFEDYPQNTSLVGTKKQHHHSVFGMVEPDSRIEIRSKSLQNYLPRGDH
jgi:hypothetical protein